MEQRRILIFREVIKIATRLIRNHISREKRISHISNIRNLVHKANDKIQY